MTLVDDILNAVIGHHLGDGVGGIAVVHPVDILVMVHQPGDEGVAVGILDDHDGAAVSDGLVVGVTQGTVTAYEGGVKLRLVIAGYIVDHVPVVDASVLHVHNHVVGAVGYIGGDGIRIRGQGRGFIGGRVVGAEEILKSHSLELIEAVGRPALVLTEYLVSIVSAQLSPVVIGMEIDVFAVVGPEVFKDL